MLIRVLPGERWGSALRGTRLTPDVRRILAAQGARALAYGLGSVLIGLTLADRGLSNAAVGVVLASLLAGAALISVLIARHGDRVGRRRCYRLLFVGMAIAGALFVSYSQSRSGDLASPFPELAATTEEHGVVPPLSVYVDA